MPATALPLLTVYVASWNTAQYTELCVRSLHRYADAPFHLVVGDSDSRDGSAEMLQALADQGWLELDGSPVRLEHTHWLDHWLASTEAEHVAFCDSDMQFLRSGYLSRLARAARDGAAMASAEVLRGGHYEDWRGETHLMPRPAPWLMLAHAPSLRSLQTSFRMTTEPANEYPEGQKTYDIGSKLYHAVIEAGMSYETLGWRFRRSYRHFGGASWGTRSPQPVGRIRRRHAALVLNQGLEMMRRGSAHPSRLHR